MIHRSRLGVLGSLILFLAVGQVFGDGASSQLFDDGASPRTGVVPAGNQILTEIITSSAQDPTPPKKKSSKKKSSSKKTSSVKKKAPKKKANPLKISGSFKMAFLYTDNIYHYSSEYLDDFRRSKTPHKFAMNTYDDLVLQPKISLRFGKKLFKKGPTKLNLSLSRNHCTSNHNKSKNSFSVSVRQPAWGKDWINIGYSLTPYSYIRKMSDRPPFVPRSVPIEYVAFQYTNNTFSFEYSHRFSYAYRFHLRAGRVIRYYNQPHMENDNWEWYIGGKFYWYASKQWLFAVEYRYSDAPARSADSEGETLDISDNSDPSFERDAYYLSLRYAPKGKLWIVKYLAATLVHQGYYFTSDKVLYRDGYHVGRLDEIRKAQFKINTEKVYKAMSLEFGYLYDRRRTTSPWEGVDIDKNYDENRFWVGMSYPF